MAFSSPSGRDTATANRTQTSTPPYFCCGWMPSGRSCSKCQQCLSSMSYCSSRSPTTSTRAVSGRSSAIAFANASNWSWRTALAPCSVGCWHRCVRSPPVPYRLPLLGSRCLTLSTAPFRRVCMFAAHAVLQSAVRAMRPCLVPELQPEEHSVVGRLLPALGHHGLAAAGARRSVLKAQSLPVSALLFISTTAMPRRNLSFIGAWS